tara:strand:- start:1120 stop:1611 length:492 start_codon:yes stop_codon:yes gene_type:complete
MKLDTNVKFKNKYIKIINYKSKNINYTKVDRPDTIIIISRYNLEYLLIKKKHFKYKRLSWEFPMGNIKKYENYILAAKREFKEETGQKISKCKLIGKFIPNPGLSKQKALVVLVDLNNKKFKIKKNKIEKILKLKFYKLKDIKKMIKENKIFDGFSLSAINFI